MGATGGKPGGVVQVASRLTADSGVMSNTTTTNAPSQLGRRSNLIVTGVTVLLAALFIRSGITALTGGAESEQTFADIGLGQWLRVFTGILEVGLAVALLVPRLTGLAAIGLAGVMTGAVAAELFTVDDGNAVAPLTFLLLAAGVAWFRRDRVLALRRATP
jgi:putative oxidoreductase